MPNPPCFEVGEHGLNAPSHAVVEYLVFGWSHVHGDDPRLFVAIFMEHTDVGDDARSIKFRFYNTFRHQLFDLTGHHLASLMLQRKVAL